MYPLSIQKLIDLFTKFPGIGPRQAARLTFFVLKNGGFAEDLSSSLTEAKNKIASCQTCFRLTEKNTTGGVNCHICSNPRRDASLITVVEKETDLAGVEKSGSYNGLYHVLGGVISPLDSDSPKKLKLRELFERVNRVLEKEKKAELVLATNPTTEGDTTAMYIERILAPLKNKNPGFVISRLARGLALGTELEYVDESTLKNAFSNRKNSN